MQLTTTSIEGYCRLLEPELPDEALSEFVAAFRARLSSGQCAYEDYFVVETPERGVVGAASLVRIGERSFAIATPRVAVDSPEAEAVIRQLIVEALSRARELDASEVGVRVEGATAGTKVATGLEALGFELRDVRIEFAAPLERLPDDSGSPLSWRYLGAPPHETRHAAAETISRCAKGDPDWRAGDDALELLDRFLDDTALYSQPDCLQFAYANGELAGAIIAQVEMATGRSLIPYMGLLPRFRGMGYGPWLHRHGFAMLKVQGGILYQGGTVQKNAPMLALFRRHRCGPEQILGEWYCSMVGEQP